MNNNPYITKINTEILKKLFPKDKSHLALKDNIGLDYKKYNCFEEDFYIADSKVEQTYDSSLGKVYISTYRPKSNYVDLSTDFDIRLYILKSFTLRYLISHALDKYLDFKCHNFTTEKELSSFDIDNIFFDNEASMIKEILEKSINSYLGFGLDIIDYIQNDEVYTKILGIYDGPYIGPHLRNISEVKSFKIVSYKYNKTGITIYFDFN